MEKNSGETVAVSKISKNKVRWTDEFILDVCHATFIAAIKNTKVHKEIGSTELAKIIHPIIKSWSKAFDKNEKQISDRIKYMKERNHSHFPGYQRIFSELIRDVNLLKIPKGLENTSQYLVTDEPQQSTQYFTPKRLVRDLVALDTEDLDVEEGESSSPIFSSSSSASSLSTSLQLQQEREYHSQSDNSNHYESPLKKIKLDDILNSSPSIRPYSLHSLPSSSPITSPQTSHLQAPMGTNAHYGLSVSPPQAGFVFEHRDLLVCHLLFNPSFYSLECRLHLPRPNQPVGLINILSKNQQSTNYPLIQIAYPTDPKFRKDPPKFLKSLNSYIKEYDHPGFFVVFFNSQYIQQDQTIQFL